MFVVFCPIADRAALWAYRGLRARGLAPLELVTSEVLASSLRWEHRLSNRRATVRIDLADGRRLDGSEIFGVLNRMPAAPRFPLERARPEDRDYASQELSAFFLSWLRALPGIVLNPPTPQGLAGAVRRPAEWMRLAITAGLAVSRLQFGVPAAPGDGRPLAVNGAERKTVFVVGDHVVAARGPADHAPPEVSAACRRFAELSATRLVGIEFAVRPSAPRPNAPRQGSWVFQQASAVPDLRRGGEPLLDALANSLGG